MIETPTPSFSFPLIWGKSLFVSFTVFGIWDLPCAFMVQETIRSLDRVYMQNVASLFFSFFFSSLVFLLHYSKSIITIPALHWFFKPLWMHVFQLSLTYLVWCQLGLALRQFKKFKKDSWINTHLLVALMCLQDLFFQSL